MKVIVDEKELKKIKKISVSDMDDKSKDILDICIQRQCFETGVFEKKDNGCWIKTSNLQEAKRYA